MIESISKSRGQYLLNRISPEILNIIEDHWNTIPIKVGKLAQELGIIVKIAPLEMNYSGMIYKEKFEKYTIKVNKFENKTRQRFTIAHEISHFILHRDIIDQNEEGIKDNILYRSGNSIDIEYEANALAAEIIMPKHKIEEFLNKFDRVISDTVISEMAEMFNVSKSAMEIRLK